MSIQLRIILVIVSFLVCIYISKKLKKAQLQVPDAFFWIILSLLFIILSVFPGISYWFTKIMGMVAPVNFIFLVVIFILLLKVFLLSIRISILEERLTNLVEEIAIRSATNKKDSNKDT